MKLFGWQKMENNTAIIAMTMFFIPDTMGLLERRKLMGKDEKRKVELQAVAEKFRLLCNMRIEELEDRIPGITNLLEKDALLKEIDALHELADKANEEAEHLIEEYYRNKNGV
jgi:hypothetical protein